MELRIACALAFLLLAAPVAAEAPPHYGGAFDAALYGQPTSIDPIDAQSHANATMVALVFDTLYVEEEGRVRPHLAASAPLVDDGGLSVRISLRSGVRFHDGSTMAASDVVASLRRVLREPRTAWLLGAVRSIDESRGEVVLRLRRPEPELARLLGATVTAIGKGGAPPSFRRAIGTGPFRYQRIDLAKKTVFLAAFDEHFAGRAYLDSLELRWHVGAEDEARAFELGRSTTSMRGAVAFVGHVPKYEASTIDTAATVLVFLGVGKANAWPADFGKALSLALDRRSFRGVGSGEGIEPSASSVARAFRAGATATAPRLERARSSLQQARRGSAALDRRLTRGPLEVLVDRSRPGDRDVAERVLAALFQLQIAAKIREVDAAELVRRRERGDCELFVDHLVAPIPAGPWQAAAAVAVVDAPWVAAQVAESSPTVSSMEAHREAAQRVIALFHRGMQLHYRSDLYGLQATANGLVSYDGAFSYGSPRRPSRRRSR